MLCEPFVLLEILSDQELSLFSFLTSTVSLEFDLVIFFIVSLSLPFGVLPPHISLFSLDCHAQCVAVPGNHSPNHSTTLLIVHAVNIHEQVPEPGSARHSNF